MRILKAKFKKLQNFEPSPDWKTNQWESLRAQITSGPARTFNRWQKFSFVFQHPALLKPVGNFMAMALVFVFGSWAALATVQNSLPGNFIYPAKVALEKLQVALTVDQEDKASRQTDIALKRVDELNTIVKQTAKPIDTVHVGRTVKNINKSLQEAQTNLSKLDLAKENGELARTVSRIEESTREISNSLKEAKEQLPANVRLSVSQEIDDTVATAASINAQTFELVIKQWLADDSIPENHIILKFKEKLTELAETRQVLEVEKWLAEQAEGDELLMNKVIELDQAIGQAFDELDTLFASKDYVGILLLIDAIRQDIKTLGQYLDGTLVLGVEEEFSDKNDKTSATSTDQVPVAGAKEEDLN